MGLPLFSSCSTPSSSCKARSTYVPPSPNPNPSRFSIIRMAEYGNARTTATVVEVQYPDATNYEGKKILVFKAPFAKIKKQKRLDPHFCDDGHLSPFARFEPTVDGWAAACKLAKGLT